MHSLGVTFIGDMYSRFVDKDTRVNARKMKRAIFTHFAAHEGDHVHHLVRFIDLSWAGLEEGREIFQEIKRLAKEEGGADFFAHEGDDQRYESVAVEVPYSGEFDQLDNKQLIELCRHCHVAMAIINAVAHGCKNGAFGGYVYRNRPCTNSTHHIGGLDRQTEMSGVLEWCFGEEDAFSVHAKMMNTPHRWAGLTVYKETEKGCVAIKR